MPPYYPLQLNQKIGNKRGVNKWEPKNARRVIFRRDFLRGKKLSEDIKLITLS